MTDDCRNSSADGVSSLAFPKPVAWMWYETKWAEYSFSEYGPKFGRDNEALYTENQVREFIRSILPEQEKIA